MTRFDISCPVVELRQYTLHPGQRDVLIELFDRKFVESQEANGMRILGQFRDLDDPDRFVWLRGFPDMTSRADALGGFYGGPVWRAHRAAANATMIDSHDVLLLRPTSEHATILTPAAVRHPADAPVAPPSSRLLATIYHSHPSAEEAFADLVHNRVRPALIEAGAEPVACLQTEHAPNTFPALPVRTGESVFVWIARFADQVQLDEHLRHMDVAPSWRDDVAPSLSTLIAGPPQHLRLAPTTRSWLC